MNEMIRSWRPVALAAVLSAALAVVTMQVDAPWALAALVATAGLIAMVVWPEMATVVVLFVVYANLTVLLRSPELSQLAGPLLALLLMIPLARHLVVRRESLRIDPTFLLMLAFLGILLASSFLAKDGALAAEHVAKFAVEGLFLYLLISNVIRNRWSLRRAVWVVLVAGSLLGFLSLYQATFGSREQQFGGLAQRDLERMMEREEKGENNAEVTHSIRIEDRAAGPVAIQTALRRS